MKRLEINIIEEGMGMQEEELSQILGGGGGTTPDKPSCNCKCFINFGGNCGCNGCTIGVSTGYVVTSDPGGSTPQV
jgi:hypothetical protein